MTKTGSTKPKQCTVPGQSRIAPPLSTQHEGISQNEKTTNKTEKNGTMRLVTEETYSATQARGEAERCLASIVCTYCEVCTLICPDLCITRNHETGHIQIDLDYCKGCGLCAHFCPKGALEMVMQ